MGNINLAQTSACLITKEKKYPMEILQNLLYWPFGEVLILTHSNHPYNKYELFNKAKFDTLYYQDDDVIVNVRALLLASEPNELNIGMDAPKIEQYKNTRMTMGMGWGAFFPKHILKNLKKYTDIYGEDNLFKRDTEKILTYLTPHRRIEMPHQDLPSAMAGDRLWREPNHWSNMELIEQRCSTLV